MKGPMSLMYRKRATTALWETEEPQDFVDVLVQLANDHLKGKKKRYWSTIEPYLFEFLDSSGEEYWCATTHEVDSYFYDPSEIADELGDTISENRYSELQDGAEPTAKELDSAKRRYCENGICEDTREATDYFQFKSSDGKQVFFCANRIYDGSYVNLTGPYPELWLPKEGWSGESLVEIIRP
jgi:hypothetical protein